MFAVLQSWRGKEFDQHGCVSMDRAHPKGTLKEKSLKQVKNQNDSGVSVRRDVSDILREMGGDWKGDLPEGTRVGEMRGLKKQCAY